MDRLTRGGGVGDASSGSGLHGLRWHNAVLEGTALAQAIGVLTGVLSQRGLREGDVVALRSDDSGRTPLTLLALANLRVAVVVLQNEHQCRQALDLEPSIRAIVVLNRVSTSTLSVIDVSTEVRAIQHGALDAGLARLATPVDLRPWFAAPRALGVLTSGTTTGTPELVWKSGPVLVENSLATATALGYASDDVFLPLLPLAHQYGISVVLIATVLGANLVISPRTRVGEALRVVGRHRVTAVDAAPRLYQSLLDAVRREPDVRRHLASVRVWGVGGAPLPAALQQDFTDLVGLPLVDGYGSTQLGNVAFLETGRPTAGLVPIETYDIRVVVDGRPAVGDEAGRLLVRRRDGRPLAGVPGGGVTPDGWFDTGDVGHLKDGRLFVHGRDGAINRRGHTLRLSTLESRLRAHGVQAELIPTGDVQGDEGFWAVVEDPLHRRSSVWRSRCAEVLDEHEMPDRIEVLGALPVVGGEKVSRAALETLVKDLRAGRGAEPGALDPRIKRLLAIAREQRETLTGLAAELSDPSAAAAEFRAFLRILENAQAEMSLYRPVAGPEVSVFMPSNNLLESFGLFCLVPGLWAQRVRARPARNTGTVLHRINALFDGTTGLDVQVVQATQKDFTAAVAARPGVVVFCGRRSNAERVARTLGRAHLFLFFGKGYNPVVVTEDAELASAAREVVDARLFNGGQDCLAPDVIFVQSSVAGKFTELLVRRMEEHRDEIGAITPIRDRSVLLRAVEHLVDNGGRLRHGGTVDYARGAVSPAVLTWRMEEHQSVKEHFAPVFDVVSYVDTRAVVERLLAHPYVDNALGVTTYGLAESHAWSLSSRYTVAAERSLFDCVQSFEPFGGYGSEAGFLQYRGTRTYGPILISRAVRDHWVVPASRPRGVPEAAGSPTGGGPRRPAASGSGIPPADGGRPATGAPVPGVGPTVVAARPGSRLLAAELPNQRLEA